MGARATAARLTAQRLAGPPATSPEDVAGRLLAVQAQDPRGVRLAVRSRSTGLTATDVDTALTDRRSLVVAWLQRGTLHLVPAEDYWWLHPLTTPQLRTANQRRLRQEGVDEAQAERGVEVVLDAVAAGPLTRDQLRARLDDAGVPTARQALVHVLLAASLDADLVRGPVVEGQQAFVSAARWLGPAPPALDRPDALARLAVRYLEGHGPASATDLAKWAGITLGAAREGLAAAGDLVEPVAGEVPGLVDLPGRAEPAPLPPPRLLGPFDPLLHGWADRSPFVGAHQGVVTTNGLFRACALVEGRVVAIWRLAGGRLTIDPLEPLPDAVTAALDADAADVRRFLGLP
ncbi:MAG: winged helix DNA-binding domain-containing protein [Angustibacter sp.]